MDAFCFSTRCIEEYLITHDAEYIKICKAIKDLESYKKMKFGKHKLDLSSKIAKLKYDKRALLQNNIYGCGVNKGAGFYVGDDCPDCGWALKLGNAKYTQN